MRIDEIANNAKYRIDEQFQNLTISKILKFSKLNFLIYFSKSLKIY